MLRGLWRLTWIEIKIFVREPLGVFGTVGVPILMFLVIGRLVGPALRRPDSSIPRIVGADLPVFVSIFIAIGAVVSLVAIMAIYREGGILRRLRAPPIRPHTILLAHVLVKLLFTSVTLVGLTLAGRRFYPVGSDVPLVSFGLAVVFSTICILSLGFLIASIVPTARFAQPIGAVVLYPMLGISGLFGPLDALPPTLQTVAQLLPFTHAVSLLRGVWRGEGWSGHAGDVAALLAIAAACTIASAKTFRWE
ncbi:MAG: ABC transporter permease [Vicinamibacterales bacterium]